MEVPRNGDVVQGEDYRAAPLAVLGGAGEALGGSHLPGGLFASYLLTGLFVIDK